MYQSEGKTGQAEALYLRALGIREQALGPDHLDVADSLARLVRLYFVEGKYAQAENLCQRVLAIRAQALGEDAPDVARSANSLATLRKLQGKDAQLEALYERTLAITERARGAGHPEVAATLHNLANLYRDQGKYLEADGFYQGALAIKETTLGPRHPDIAGIFSNLAISSSRTGDAGTALAYARRASALTIGHPASYAPVMSQEISLGAPLKPLRGYFRLHVTALAAAAGRGIEPKEAAGREAAEMAQWAAQSAAAESTAPISIRLASAGGLLGALVREQHELSAAWREQGKGFSAALTTGRQNRAPAEEIRKRIAEIETNLIAINARLDREFPDYVALTRPKPIKIEEVQRLLDRDEALVFWLLDEPESHVFAVSREAFAWKTSPVSEKTLADKVTALRRGLDLEEVQHSLEAGKPALFDLALAHELYDILLNPVEGLIKNKRHLLVVPSGPLIALPMHLLVTETARARPLRLEDLAAYRDAAWLIKRHAVSVLPSVATLKSLRTVAHKEAGKKPLLAFGDPAFALSAAAPADRPSSPPAPTKPSPAQKENAVAAAFTPPPSAKQWSYADFWLGTEIDRDKLAQALPPIPDSADELRAVARRLGAPASEIHLGLNANEATVKRASLADYRVIYFATHGLVAGVVKPLAEPALALTLPAQASDLDDGLLTASEVAQLRVNADWVVLSGCNTVAGDQPAAEALFGLARAVLYAGTRALLVSHWTADRAAAARLTTATFDIEKSRPTLGRAEALRRAMLAYLDDPTEPRNAYPAFWGPFFLIGEGAAR